MTKPFFRFVGFLLHVANSSPPLHRTDFYAMKQRILERHGKLVGHDVQFIEKKCWGDWDDEGYRAGCKGKGCRRCGGSGVFDFFWVTLERWELGGRIFHRPIRREHSNPGNVVTITGRIEHRSYGKWSKECALWLAIIFDRPLFWRMFWSGHGFGLQPPICMMQRVLVPIRWKFRGWLSAAWKPFRKHECCCGESYRRWFRRDTYWACRTCTAKAQEDLDNGIPF